MEVVTSPHTHLLSFGRGSHPVLEGVVSTMVLIVLQENEFPFPHPKAVKDCSAHSLWICVMMCPLSASHISHSCSLHRVKKCPPILPVGRSNVHHSRENTLHRAHDYLDPIAPDEGSLKHVHFPLTSSWLLPPHRSSTPLPHAYTVMNWYEVRHVSLVSPGQAHILQGYCGGLRCRLGRVDRSQGFFSTLLHVPGTAAYPARRTKCSRGAKDCKVLVGAKEVEPVRVCQLEHQRGEEDEFNCLLV